MTKFSTLLLVLVFSLTSVFGGCEKDEKKEDSPQTSVSLEGGAEAGTQAGEEAGQQAGEEVEAGQQAGEDVEGGQQAGVEDPLDQGVGGAGEMAGDQDVSGGSQSEDCAPEFQSEEGCDEPQPVTDPACEPESLEEGEDCDDNVDPDSEESSSEG